MRRSRPLARAGPLLLVVSLGCVGPARTAGDYVLKARNTVEDMSSAVATARLAAETGVRQRGFGAYLSVVANDAEADATSIQSTFESIRPPGAESDRLRESVSGVLSDAVGAVADVRIAARRGDRPGLGEALVALRRASSELDELRRDLS